MKRFLVALSIFFASASSAACANADVSASSSEPQQMQDFNIVGYSSKGQKTWEVQGNSMDMLGNEVKISGITAKMYGDKENMVLTADNGHFDKETGVVHLQDNVRAVTESGAELKTNTLDWSQKQQLITTDDKVNITKDNMSADATGLSVKPDLKEAKFGKDVVLTIEEQKKAEDSQKPSVFSQKGKMVITCEGPMELNYEKQFAVFEKNVKVEGDAEQGTMVSDKMTVYFSPATKQIERIEAQGHVKIVRGESTSFSEGAVFTASDKKVILTGRPKLMIFTEEGSHVSP